MLEKNSATATSVKPSDREFVMERVFNAPVKLVYKAMTDPELIPQWWGPRRYTTIIEKQDVRPGGLWRFVQHDAQGNEFAFNGEYREVVPSKRLSYTFEYEGTPGHIIVNTVTFQEVDGKTKVTVSAVFQSMQDRDEMLAEGMEEGASEGYDRLAELLASMA